MRRSVLAGARRGRAPLHFFPMEGRAEPDGRPRCSAASLAREARARAARAPPPSPPRDCARPEAVPVPASRLVRRPSSCAGIGWRRRRSTPCPLLGLRHPRAVGSRRQGAGAQGFCNRHARVCLAVTTPARGSRMTARHGPMRQATGLRSTIASSSPTTRFAPVCTPRWTLFRASCSTSSSGWPTVRLRAPRAGLLATAGSAGAIS